MTDPLTQLRAPKRGNVNSARLQAQRESSRQSLITRLQAAYAAHPDRDYAESMYGAMLRQMGEEPAQ